jgi:hypothetical protein
MRKADKRGRAAWNINSLTIRIVVAGKHVEHWLNGQRVVSFETDAPEVEKQLRSNMAADDHGPVREEGPISLQNHSSETWFRNIRIKRL